MAMDTIVSARIDSATNVAATAALEALGLSVSDAIRLLMVYVAEEKRLPFTVQIPNRTTVNAIKELEAGKGERFDSADQLFKDLGI